MMTNTYKPIVGGVERSIEIFTKEFRKKGHKVVIIAPEFSGMPENEYSVIRLPAIQNFNDTDFSVQLPIPGLLTDFLEEFQPDIIHSHHPFLIGNTALRIASEYKKPLIFTFHTLYEKYTHYLPGDSPELKRFVVTLSTGYANLCSHVIAPSQSVADLLCERKVEVPVDVIPTGIYLDQFSDGSGEALRKSLNIPEKAFVVGHVGRIEKEKNMDFLAESIAQFLHNEKNVHFLLVGQGSQIDEVQRIFHKKKLDARLHMTRILEGKDLVDAYHAMDVFAFASQTETQGLVLMEAMAAGVPVLAVDGSGSRDIVQDSVNGRLLPAADKNDFVKTLAWFKALSDEKKRALKRSSQKTARKYSVKNCVKKMLAVYTQEMQKKYIYKDPADSGWEKTMRVIKAEWDIIANMTEAAKSAFDL